MRWIAGVLFLASLLLAGSAFASTGSREVRIKDECDASTFPAFTGCIPGGVNQWGRFGGGDVTFDEFLARLNPDDGGHNAWRFAFGRGRIEADEALKVTNTGGEPHTFTEVARFGTGDVPPLDAALPPGTPPAVRVPGGLDLILGPGQSETIPAGSLSRGRHRFQCMIHPWMRVTVQVRSS